MEFKELVLKRRSSRVFGKRSVEREKILGFIDVARHSPSACNLQNWHFLAVDDQDLLKKLHFVGAFHTSFSPVVIFVFYDKRFINKPYQDHIQSASIAAITLIYAACNEGLSSCYVCDLPPENYIKKLLRVPNYFSLVCMVNLGYPSGIPSSEKKIKGVDGISSFNVFERKESYTGMPQAGYKEQPFFSLKKWIRKIIVLLYLRNQDEKYMKLAERMKKWTEMTKSHIHL